MPQATTPSTSTLGTKNREEELNQHLGLVYHVARQLSRARAMDLELDELVSAGTIGLIEAFNNFDQSRGLAFSTFAAPRIRGAMLDEMRRQDHVPRSVRRRVRELSSATEALTKELGCIPEPAKIARRLGVDLDTYFRWQWEGDGARFVPLDRSAEGATPGSRNPNEHVEAATDPDVEDRLTHAQEVSRLRTAIAELPPTERQVLSLYYFEDLKLGEIAQILGVSESRVSQIRARAVLRLRDAMGSLRAAVA
jgi:RNA polymerase sigma factor for flagellar operon FliA